LPWNPSGIRAGSWTLATGSAVKSPGGQDDEIGCAAVGIVHERDDVPVVLA